MFQDGLYPKCILEQNERKSKSGSRLNLKKSSHNIPLSRHNSKTSFVAISDEFELDSTSISQDSYDTKFLNRLLEFYSRCFPTKK
eukprot:Pgem_evm1s10094